MTHDGKTKKIPKKTDCSFGISLILVTLAVFTTSTHIKPKEYQKKPKKYPQKTWTLPNLPSVYYFPYLSLVLCVYVDDLTLSGPTIHHEGFWSSLSKQVDLEPFTPLGRVLGRSHRFVLHKGMKALSLETEILRVNALTCTKSCPAKPRSNIRLLMSILALLSSLMTFHVWSFQHLPLGW